MRTTMTKTRKQMRMRKKQKQKSHRLDQHVADPALLPAPGPVLPQLDVEHLLRQAAETASALGLPERPARAGMKPVEAAPKTLHSEPPLEGGSPHAQA